MKKRLRQTRKYLTFVLLCTTVLAILVVGLLQKELYKEMVSIVTDDIWPAILALLILFGFVVGGVVKNPPKSFDKFLENGLLQIAVLEIFLFVTGLLIYSYLQIMDTKSGTIEVMLEPSQEIQIKALKIWEGDTTKIKVPKVLPNVKPGNYTFIIIEEGFQAFELSISLDASEDVTVILEAQKITGTLIVDTEPQGAEIWVDGSFEGLTTPDTLEDLERKYINVELKLSGFQYVTKEKVDLKSKSQFNLGTVILLKLYKIRFICYPNDIEFTVNNQNYIGSQTKVLLPEGTYTITSKRGNQNYLPKQINVNKDKTIPIP